MMRQYVESQSHLTVFAKAQGRISRGKEGNNHGVSNEEDENGGVTTGPEMRRWRGGLENGLESQGGIDHMSPRDGRVRTVRATDTEWLAGSRYVSPSPSF